MIAIFVLNSALDNHFLSYGTDWVRWKSSVNATEQMDFEERSQPTPGNRMLPSFGMCDLTDSRLDATKVYANKVKVICELSTHVLYQYVFLLLWFVLIVSLIVSCIGVVLNIAGHIKNTKFSRKNSPQKVYKLLTVRECEYLEFIRRRDLTTYGAVVKKLNHMNSPYSNNNNHNHFENENDELESMKMVAVSDA